jgi:hypothetical protein
MARVRSGKHLADALRSREVSSRIIPFPQDGPAEIGAAAAALAEQIDKLGRPPTINITGGTKPMALALVQELAGLLDSSPTTRPDIVYTNTKTQQLEWLAREPVLQPMKAMLEINDILRVYGYEHDSSRNTRSGHDAWLGVAIERFEATQQLAQGIGRLVDHVSELAGKASESLRALDQGGEFRPRQALDRPAGSSMTAYLDLLNQHGILDYQAGRDIEFRGPEAARYCAGGWLEEFAAVQTDRVRQFGLEIHGNWRANVFPKSTQGEVLNEIDLMVVHNNRALLVECKAGRLDDDDVNSWLSKLDDMAKRVAGIQAGRLLVSARKLTDAQRGRASLMGISTCSGADLQHFSRYLQHWMQHGSFRDYASG